MGNKSEFNKQINSLRDDALGKLDAIIQSYSVLQEQYNFLIKDNPNIPDRLRLTTLQQFLDIVRKMKAGLVAAKSCVVDGKIMGDQAIPSDIGWVSGKILGESESKIGYQKDGDRILITGLCIAELADSASKNLGYRYDKLDCVVRAEDLALLLMVEEASHRYDVQVRGLEFGDSTANRQHPVELNAVGVIKQVVSSLGIPLFE